MSTSAAAASATVISFFRHDWTLEAADLAFRQVVEQARLPVFYREYGVPDTLDGRFELICLHAFLYLHRLKAEGPQAARVSQNFFDRMFADFDRALREMGTGDLSVGKQVKRMARGFYGRARAYQDGIAGDDRALSAALARNLFATASAAGSARRIAAMAEYVRGAAEELRVQTAAGLLAGRVRFPAPAAAGSGAAVLASGVVP